MRKTLLSLAALAALGLASAPAMASDHGKSMSEAKKHHSSMKSEADGKRKDMERKGKHSKNKAEDEGRKKMKHAKEKMKDDSEY
ncbi:MAG: hypothetical protein Q9M23_03290 [Mariprofundaceae bacterium]|nr:hypothetical protein [Mariprofundaceae bacterium]